MQSLRSLFHPVTFETPLKLPGRAELLRTSRLVGRFLVGQRTLFIQAMIALGIEAAAAVFEVYPLAYLIDYLKGDRPAIPEGWGFPTVISPHADTVALL